MERNRDQMVPAETRAHYDLRTSDYYRQYSDVACLTSAYIRGEKLGRIASQRVWTERLRKAFQQYGISYEHLSQIKVVESFDNYDHWSITFVLRGIEITVGKEVGVKRDNPVSYDISVSELFEKLRNPVPLYEVNGDLLEAMVRIFKKYCEPHLDSWSETNIWDKISGLLSSRSQKDVVWRAAFDSRFDRTNPVVSAVRNLAQLADPILSSFNCWEARREAEKFCLSVGIFCEQKTGKPRLIVRDEIWQTLKGYIS